MHLDEMFGDGAFEEYREALKIEDLKLYMTEEDGPHVMFDWTKKVGWGDVTFNDTSAMYDHLYLNTDFQGQGILAHVAVQSALLFKSWGLKEMRAIVIGDLTPFLKVGFVQPAPASLVLVAPFHDNSPIDQYINWKLGFSDEPDYHRAIE